MGKGPDESLAASGGRRRVENRQMLGSKMRCAFERSATEHEIGCLGNVCGAKPEMREHRTVGKDRIRNARCLAVGRRDREHVERRFEGKRTRELRLDRLDRRIREAHRAQLLRVDVWRTDKGAGSRHVRHHRGDVLLAVAQTPQRRRNAPVDDLQVTAAGQLLCLHERVVGLNAGRVAIHQDADVPAGAITVTCELR